MLASLAAIAAATTTAGGASAHSRKPATEHVLLLSVDGLHQSDLVWFVQKHPGSALARLVRKGVEFTHALTPFPSDSFPGMVGQVTGGNPKTTGVYYDDSWNRALLPAGTTSCAGATPGAEVTYSRASRMARSSMHSTPPGPRPIRAPATSSRSRSTTTRC
jgi:hypothetical protein